ncbi:hypothetical protein [Conchiformibius steedae]|uniref:Uncharacterized protein n=1 Tax=Conchiformibius steedae TaxID=153493 RepID=A0A3P2AB13_9NEIS|nr:hypothetical protein [Conchiformibius steedae]RRD90803.1 hypothetical protein EII21_04145 [Conchiformibius steedae]
MNTENLGLYVLIGIIAASLFGVLVQAGIKRGIIQHTPLPPKQRRKVLALLLFSIMIPTALPYIARTLQALFS